jgi:predicted SpoU family rRNA methylase
VFDSDTRAVNRIGISVQAAQALGANFNIEWTCADNSKLPLDHAAMAGVPVALAMYANSLHDVAAELKARIRAATTHVQLDAINIMLGWPGNQPQ